MVVVLAVVVEIVVVGLLILLGVALFLIEVGLVALILIDLLDHGNLLSGLRNVHVGDTIFVWILPYDFHLLVFTSKLFLNIVADNVDLLLAHEFLLGDNGAFYCLVLALFFNHLAVLFELVRLQVALDKGLGELVLGYGLGKQLGDAFGQEFSVEDLAHGGAFHRILDKHLLDDQLEVLGVVRRDSGVGRAQDLEDEALHGVGVEGVAERAHLVEDAAEGPDVRLLVVGLLLADLRGQVVGRADGGLGAVVGVLEHSGDAEVADFDLSVLVHEDVLRLEVSVEDLAVVDVLYGQRHLHEPVHDLVLRVAHLPYFLLVRDLRVHVASVCVVHHYAQAPLVHEALLVRDDVRVSQSLQNMNLIYGILSLFPVHPRHVDYLYS